MMYAIRHLDDLLGTGRKWPNQATDVAEMNSPRASCPSGKRCLAVLAGLTATVLALLLSSNICQRRIRCWLCFCHDRSTKMDAGHCQRALLILLSRMGARGRRSCQSTVRGRIELTICSFGAFGPCALSRCCERHGKRPAIPMSAFSRSTTGPLSPSSDNLTSSGPLHLHGPHYRPSRHSYSSTDRKTSSQDAPSWSSTFQAAALWPWDQSVTRSDCAGGQGAWASQSLVSITAKHRNVGDHQRDIDLTPQIRTLSRSKKALTPTGR